MAGYDLCTGWGTPSRAEADQRAGQSRSLAHHADDWLYLLGGVGGPFTVTSAKLFADQCGDQFPDLDACQYVTLAERFRPSAARLAPGGPATNVTVSLNSVASNLVVGTIQCDGVVHQLE